MYTSSSVNIIELVLDITCTDIFPQNPQDYHIWKSQILMSLYFKKKILKINLLFGKNNLYLRIIHYIMWISNLRNRQE